MNSGNVPGYLINDLNQALRSAFPSKAELEMMVQFQFSQNLDDIALGENLRVIVYQLEEYFLKEGKLTKLIDGALEEKPDNPELQEVAQKFKTTISLFKILQPLEGRYIETMQQAYQACADESVVNDWEEEIPETPETLIEIFDGIEEASSQNYDEKLSQFAVNLLKNQDIPKKEASKLNKWGKKYTGKFYKQLSHRENDVQDKDTTSHLIIIFHPCKQYKQRYWFEAWFIPYGEEGKFNSKTGEGYISINQDGENNKKIKFEEKEIADLLKFCFGQIYQQPTFSRHQTSIEFILPNELLNQPVDNWTIAADEDEHDIPSPIGNEYKVIVRSYKRLKKYWNKNDWERKWNTFVKCGCSECFVSDDDCNADEGLETQLYYNLLKEHITALKLIKSPSPEVFPKILAAINKSAIPVALWIREELQHLNIRQEIDELLKCSIMKLPEQVKEKRLQASAAVNRQTHIGNHISLLWENPYILPPSPIDYKMP
ncbi:MAG: effector-associated domain EAD1-containing protein [Cyanobacteria bacterium J06633_8]